MVIKKRYSYLMRVHPRVTLTLFIVVLIWSATPFIIKAAPLIISQHTGVSQPYNSKYGLSLGLNDPRYFIAPGTISSLVVPAANFRNLTGTEKFQLKLNNYYFSQVKDCKTPVKTADEWGITHIAKDPYAPMVTFGPFTGTQCAIAADPEPYGGGPRAVNVLVYRDGNNLPDGNLGVMGNNFQFNFTVYGPDIPDKPKVSNVLFLPGIEASRLYEDASCASGICETKLWEPFGDALASRLAHDASGASVNSGIYVKKGSIIDNAYLPLKGDIYKSFIAQMNDLVAAGTINEWEAGPYDWRLSLEQILGSGAEVAPGKISYLAATSSPYLIQELRRLAKNSRTGKVTIVAHSNGGLLAKALTTKLGAESSKLIDKIIFVAVPQVGTPQAVGALLHGYDQGLPSQFISYGLSGSLARTLAQNMPMTYQLLPSANYFTYTDNPIITISADPLLAPWRAAYGDMIHSGSLLRTFLTDSARATLPTSDPLVSPIVGNSTLLTKAETLHTELDAWTPPVGVDLTEIAGWGEETLATIHYYQGLASRCTARKADSTCAALVISPVLQYAPKTVLDGDGTVAASSALWTPGAKRYWVDLKTHNKPRLTISRKHAGVLEIPQLRTFIQNIITNATSSLPQFISVTIPTDPDISKSRLHFTLHSPLSLDLYDDQGNHTGISTTTRELEENIPGSRYLKFGEVQYISAPASVNTRLIMNGYDEGSFTLDLAETQGGSVLATTTFAGIPSSASTVASISVPTEGGIASASPLVVDENGDGAVDITLIAKPGEMVIPDLTPPISSAFSTGALGINDWYRSPVTVTLNASDEGSGVRDTLYSLDNGATWNIYSTTTPLILSDEGTATILYYSTDNAGNTEEQKSLTVKIDATAPEAVLSFSPTTRSLTVLGRDHLSPVEVTAAYTLTDEAGNITILSFKKEKDKENKNEREGKVHVELSEVSYTTFASTTRTVLPKNELQYIWEADKKDALSHLEQELKIQGNRVAHAVYNSKKNETKIFVREKDIEEKLKETKPGLVILRLVTDQGKLNFEY